MTDRDEALDLRKWTRATDVEVLVAPAVVYEVLRTPDPQLRGRLLKTVTAGWWTRLMTEVYNECADVREAMVRHRPEWLRRTPDRATYFRHRGDWVGGCFFCCPPRHDSAAEAERLLTMEGDVVDLAREEARLRRAEMSELAFETVKLDGVAARPGRPVAGWEDSDVEPWRLISATWWGEALRDSDHPVSDWLGPWVDRAALGGDVGSWNHFWLHEVETRELPREWMRWAVMLFQALRKVTPGTPADNQISLYTHEADLFVSADKALVEILDRVREHAPAPIAEPRRSVQSESALVQLKEWL